MTNRPKQIGTRTETAIVRAARDRGFPHAERIAPHGTVDQGDVHLTPGLTAGVIIESKGGKAAENASDAQIVEWLDEAEQERVNRGAAIAFLVTKRKAVGAANAHRWSAHMTVRTFLELAGGTDAIAPPDPQAPLRMTFDSALALLRAAGYGTAHVEEANNNLHSTDKEPTA